MFFTALTGWQKMMWRDMLSHMPLSLRSRWTTLNNKKCLRGTGMFVPGHKSSKKGARSMSYPALANVRPQAFSVTLGERKQQKRRKRGRRVGNKEELTATTEPSLKPMRVPRSLVPLLFSSSLFLSAWVLHSAASSSPSLFLSLKNRSP